MDDTQVTPKQRCILGQLLHRKLPTALITVGLGILAFALAIGPKSHLPFPTHVDEWTHLAYADALVQSGYVPHVEPLYGQETVGFRPELGFRVLLAELQLATGLQWDAMFPVLPGVVFAVFVVAMSCLGQSLGIGSILGVLALGTPTTLRFLGPSYAVPVALALVFVTALLIVALQPSLRKKWGLVVLASVLLLGLLFVHPLTVVVAAPVLIAVFSYITYTQRKSTPRTVLAALGLSVLLPLVWFLSLVATIGPELLSEATRSVERGQGLVRNYVYDAGFVRVALFALAAFAITLWKSSDRSQAPYWSLLIVPGLFIAFIGLHAVGILPFSNLYDRTWLYLDMALCVMGGLGLAILANKVRLKDFWKLRLSHNALPYAIVVLAGLIFANAWYIQATTPRYQLTTAATLEDFHWIRENLSDVQGTTLVHPLTAVVYPAAAGRPVFANASEPRPSSMERVQRAVELLEGKSADVHALQQEGIGIVYQPSWQDTQGMLEVHTGVFLTPPYDNLENPASVDSRGTTDEEVPR